MGASKVFPVLLALGVIACFLLEQQALATDVPAPPGITFTCVKPATTEGQTNYCAPCKGPSNEGKIGCHCTMNPIPSNDATKPLTACTCCKQDNCDQVKDLKTICCCNFPLEEAQKEMEDVCKGVFSSGLVCPGSRQ